MGVVVSSSDGCHLACSSYSHHKANPSRIRLRAWMLMAVVCLIGSVFGPTGYGFSIDRNSPRFRNDTRFVGAHRRAPRSSVSRARHALQGMGDSSQRHRGGGVTAALASPSERPGSGPLLQRPLGRPTGPGMSQEIRLFNVWSSETGRPPAVDGRLEVEVVLEAATWVEIEVSEDGGAESWTPKGPIPGLPSSLRRVVTQGSGETP